MFLVKLEAPAITILGKSGNFVQYTKRACKCYAHRLQALTPTNTSNGVSMVEASFDIGLPRARARGTERERYGSDQISAEFARRYGLGLEIFRDQLDYKLGVIGSKWIVVLEVFRLLQNDRRKRGTTEVACDKGREVNDKGPYNF